MLRRAIPLLLASFASLSGLPGCGDDDPLLQQLETLLGRPPEEYAPTCNAALERDATVTLLSSGDLSDMSGVRVVHGDLVIATSGLSTIDEGLDCVVQIDGDLVIEGVSDLETIGPNALSRLEAIGGNLTVRGNAALATPLPLFALAYVGGDVTVEDNASLRSIGDVAELATIGRSLVLRDNPSMAHVPGLDRLESLGGDLVLEGLAVDELTMLGPFTVPGLARLANNAALTSATLPPLADGATGVEVVGHPQLRTVEVRSSAEAATLAGDLKITGNTGPLGVRGFASLVEVDGDVVLSGNNGLQLVEGFDALLRVTGALTLQDNAALISTSAFASILAVEGSLTVDNNDALAGVQLGSLTTVGGALALTNNAALLTLDGLGALTGVGGLVQIVDNPMLSTCDADDLVDRLVGGGLPAANAQVANNGGC